MTTLETLAKLSAQRTARTERLHSAIKDLLSLLDDVTEVGDHATVDGLTLERRRRRTNVGTSELWTFTGTGEYQERSVCPELDLNEDKYIHGDFNCRARGPNRDDLIALASRAQRFCDAFAAQFAKEAAALDAAAEHAENAEVDHS